MCPVDLAPNLSAVTLAKDVYQNNEQNVMAEENSTALKSHKDERKEFRIKNNPFRSVTMTQQNRII